MPQQNGTYQRDADGAFLLDPQRVKPFTKNPRKIFRRIPELAKSIKICGQRQPGKVRFISGDENFDAELVDGERRLRACKLAGVEFRAYSESGITSVGDQLERSFVANFGKEDHDCMEIARGIRDIMQMNHRSLQEVTDIAGKSITWGYQHLNLLGLHPKVQEMLVPGENAESQPAQIGFTLAQNLVKLSQDLQVKTAMEIVNGGMNQIKARRHVLQVGRMAGKLVLKERRRPDKSFLALMRATENLCDSVGIYLDMSEDEFGEIMKVAPIVSKKVLRSRLVKFGQDIAKLTKKVEMGM